MIAINLATRLEFTMDTSNDSDDLFMDHEEHSKTEILPFDTPQADDDSDSSSGDSSHDCDRHIEELMGYFPRYLDPSTMSDCRELVEERYSEFQDASQSRKIQIVEEIIDTIYVNRRQQISNNPSTPTRRRRRRTASHSPSWMNPNRYKAQKDRIVENDKETLLWDISNHGSSNSQDDDESDSLLGCQRSESLEESSSDYPSNEEHMKMHGCDVLMGNFPTYQDPNHKNCYLKHLVEQRYQEYESSANNHLRQTLIAEDIVSAIYANGGQFLKPVTRKGSRKVSSTIPIHDCTKGRFLTNWWEEASALEARYKVEADFRCMAKKKEIQSVSYEQQNPQDWFMTLCEEVA